MTTQTTPKTRPQAEERLCRQRTRQRNNETNLVATHPKSQTTHRVRSVWTSREYGPHTSHISLCGVWKIRTGDRSVTVTNTT